MWRRRTACRLWPRVTLSPSQDTTPPRCRPALLPADLPTAPCGAPSPAARGLSPKHSAAPRPPRALPCRTGPPRPAPAACEPSPVAWPTWQHAPAQGRRHPQPLLRRLLLLLLLGHLCPPAAPPSSGGRRRGPSTPRTNCAVPPDAHDPPQQAAALLARQGRLTCSWRRCRRSSCGSGCVKLAPAWRSPRRVRRQTSSSTAACCPAS